MVLWIVAVTLILTFAVLIFWPLKLCFRLGLDPKQKKEIRFAFRMLGGVIGREWRLSVASIPGGLYGVWITDNKGKRFLYTRPSKPKRRIKKDARHVFFKIYKKIKVNALYVEAELGLLSDAAATALAAGAAQALVFSLLAALYPPKGIDSKKIDIRPRFDKACFNFQSRCIITIRIKHIISAGWNNLLIKRKKAV